MGKVRKRALISASAAVLALLLACSSTETGKACDGGGATSGAVLCSQVQNALCARRASCCTTGTLCRNTGGPQGCACLGCNGAPTISGMNAACNDTYEATCSGDTCTQTDCAAWMPQDPQGHDCTQAAFANKTLCSAATDACLGDIPLISCTDFTAGTWNWPASCAAFWAQF